MSIKKKKKKQERGKIALGFVRISNEALKP